MVTDDSGWAGESKRRRDRKMMPLEEEVHVLSRAETLDPLSEEDLRGLLKRSGTLTSTQERPFFPQRTLLRSSSSLRKEECGYSDNRRGASLRFLK